MIYKNIIFDFGGVLFDWDPVYLYDKVFEDKKELAFFLDNVCTRAWNEKQDAGRDWKEAEDVLIKNYPDYEYEIRLFRKRWNEMLKGTVKGSIEILDTLLKNKELKVFGITNWSGQTFPYAYYKYPFLRAMEDIVVSGDVKLVKPDEAIFKYAISRFKINPEESIFIDDNLKNAQVAAELGLRGIHFKDSKQLKKEIQNYGLL